MRINSSGLVGVNTSNPEGMLHVNSPYSSAAMFQRTSNKITFEMSTLASGGYGFYDTVAAQYDAFFKNGNVGIGTTSPGARLDLVGPSSTPLVLEINSANSNCDITMQSANTSSATRLRNGTNDLQVHTNGTERMRINSSGNVLIGTSLDTAKLVVQGAGSTSATNVTIMYNASGTGLFYIRDDGAFNTGGAAKSPYFNTTASAANLNVSAAGFLGRSTSSARYKENIRDYDQSISIDALRPVFFNSKKEGDSKTYAGLIAEEVHDAGFTEFVEYNDDGEPDAVFYANMVALCIKEIQDLKAEVAALKGA